ncbi:MAG: type II secretion system protein GspC [Myxococcaceae bacterium]
MELFFRKYFWTVHLLFILLVAFLIARTINVFVESAISPAPRAGASVRGTLPTATVALPVALTIEKIAKVTGLPVPAPEPDVKEPEQVADLSSAPVKSGLRVRLLGTLLASKPEWSIASLQDAVTMRTQTYMVDDEVQGAKVLEIERTKVIILRGGRREYIDNEAGSGEGAAPPPPVATKPSEPVASATGSGIRAVSENEYEVPKAEIDKTLSNLNDVAMQARIVPAFKDGVATGFKLFSIRPDSIYTKIGVQNGDVIRRINGFDLNSPEKALEVYTKLKEANRIDIEIERNGAVTKKTYNIR